MKLLQLFRCVNDGLLHSGNLEMVSSSNILLEGKLIEDLQMDW